MALLPGRLTMSSALGAGQFSLFRPLSGTVSTARHLSSYSVKPTFSPIIARTILSSPFPRSHNSSTVAEFLNPSPLRLLARQFSTGSSAPNNSSGLPPFISRLEYIANGNPRSASAQYALYSACMRFGRPDYVVQRYRSNQFASNAASEKLYQKALSDLYGTDSAQPTQPSGNNLSPETIQAISQAVGSRATSGVAVAKGGNGTKTSPIHVMVEESWFSTIFKLFRFLAVFGFVIWASMVVLQLFLEGTGFVKRINGQQSSEVKPELQSTRFSDVHGCDEAKEELQELVSFLKSPEKFNALGGKLPKGVLLVGPPGTGKTLLARAVAGEAGVPFFYMSGSEFDEIYVGVGAKRVRELFNAARAKAPAIVFIDELDAIGGKRNDRDATYAKQTLNQLLTDLDGFDQNSNVIFLAATNFPQLLDKALTRPGRFDRHVNVSLPDFRGRVDILKYHARNMKLASDVNFETISRTAMGFSGAKLENLVNQAAVKASKQGSKNISMADMFWALEKIVLGAERRNLVITPNDQLLIAYHEGGHALVAFHNPDADPLYKVTILPRGSALGVTYQLPRADDFPVAKKRLLAKLDVLMGGRIAEELIYGNDNVTSGASSDLRSATSIAFSMVTQMGMSDKFPNIDFSSNYDELSTETRAEIWEEVQKILNDSRARAEKLLVSKKTELETLAKALIEYEDLDLKEMEIVLKGQSLPGRAKARPTVVNGVDQRVPTPLNNPPIPSPSTSVPSPPS